MSKLISSAEFSALSALEQAQYVKSNIGAKFTDNTAPEALFEEPADSTEPTVETKFEIEGDAVFLNLNVIVAGERFRLKGIKLTETRACKDGWDKATKSWTRDHSDTMSLIDMIRKHGASLVNDHAEFDARFGKAGERNDERRDPLAALLAKG